MEDCCIILNPEAGTSRRLHVVERLSGVVSKATLCLTRQAGDAEELARQAVLQGFRTIVAGGGDGTVNEVLRGMVGSAARLGVLPLGTMNVFARELGLPLNWKAAWVRILKNEERRVDVARANQKPWAQVAGVGFDARALARVSPVVKRYLGPAAYVWAGLQQLTFRQSKLKVHLQNHEPLEGVWIIVGTGRFYAGPFSVFPNAQNGDGFLKVIVVRDLRFLRILGGITSLPMGWHTSIPGITYLQTKHLRVEALEPLDGRPCLELDGELIGNVPVDFWVEPLALRVAV